MSESRNAILTIIGFVATNAGAYLVWNFLGISPFPIVLTIFVISLVLWIVIYWVTKPKQSQERHSEKQGPFDPKQPEVFDTEVFPTEGLHAGDSITFRVKFTGIFDNIMLQAETKLPSGKWIGFRNKKTERGNRGSGWLSKGKLNGPHNGELFEWKDTIPETMKPEEYAFRIRGYQRPLYGYWLSFKLHGLLFLKEHGIIRSIDKKLLDYREWKPVHPVQDQYHKVIIS